jgi:sugar lactone lactonase YvrE
MLYKELLSRETRSRIPTIGDLGVAGRKADLTMRTRIHVIPDVTPRESIGRKRVAPLTLMVPALAALLLAASPAALRAQSVSFADAQTTVPTTDLQNPYGVAVDAAGDVFIADMANVRVVKVTLAGVQTTVPATGLRDPLGVAVDAAGDVFISDGDNNNVVEVTPAGVQTTVPATGLNQPWGLALDSAGDLFIADSSHARVVEVTPGGTQTTVPATGLGEPTGVAVDAAGDVFISDFFTNLVVEVSAGGVQSTVPATGLSIPQGVAVDKGGNVFISDTGNSRVEEVTAGGVQTTVTTSGLSYPEGVALNAQGSLFIVDNGNNRVVELQQTSVNFGSANVCQTGQTTPAPCSKTITLTFDVTASGTLGTPNVLTQGAPNLDFTLSGSTCTGAVTAGSTCTVNVIFTPQFSGVRAGAVQIVDGSGNVLASTPIYGIGQAPQIAFSPSTQTTFLSPGSLVEVGVPLEGVALDAAGNVYIVTGEPSVLELTPGGVKIRDVPIAGGYNPFGVAVDGAGDVIVANGNANNVIEITPGGVQTTIPTTGLNFPQGVAVDGAGDIFIADSNNHRVVEIPAGCTTAACQTTVPASGLGRIIGVAVDGGGDLYIVDIDNHRVVEVLAAGGQVTVPATGLLSPVDVKVDAAGDVFIADISNSQDVVEVSPAGVQTLIPLSEIEGTWEPITLAVDATGTLFVVDSNSNGVAKIQRSQPPAFSFAMTLDGQTSTDSPKSATVQNIGNQPLNAIAPGLVIDPNFMQEAGSGTPEDCTSTFSLAPGVSCNLSISFIPTTTGSISGAAVLTDNALNTSPSATQSISLTGTGLANNVAVTINTSPAGLQVSVDGGAPQTAPVSESWQIGTTHTVATTSPQTTAGTQYTFTSWSDSGAISHSVTATSGTTSYTASFSTSYQLTTAVSPSGGGTVSPVSGTYYAASTVVPVVATPNAGYVFSSWTGPVANSGSASTTVTMSAAESVTANFIATVQVVVGTSPSGLSFSVDGTPYTSAQTLTWTTGTTHTIATTSPQGTAGTQYNFTSWSDSGAISHSVTATSGTTSYTASFSTSYQLTTAVSPSGGGTVSPVSGTYYAASTVVPVVATPNAGYVFSSWTGPVANPNSASTTVTMSAPESVTANFIATVQVVVGTSPAAGLSFTVDGTTYTSAQTLTWTTGTTHTITTTSPQTPSAGTQYTFTAWSDSGAISHTVTASSATTSYTASFSTSYLLTTAVSPSGGTITPASGSYYAARTVVSVKATPNAGYVFSSWTGPVASPTSASTTVTMSAPESVTANFIATVQVVVGTSPAGLSFSVDGTTYTGAQTLTWTTGTMHTIATTSLQTPSPGTQDTFTGWSDGGAISHTVTATSTTTSYTASFSTSYLLTTAVSPSGGGTVTPVSGSYYAAGTVVSVKATPNAGYVFSSWTGPVASPTSASTTVTMSAPKSVTANFGSALAVSPSSINFGTVYYDQVGAAFVTVTNNGTSPITISSINIGAPGNAAGDFGEISSCAPFIVKMPGTLAAGKSCTIAVGFLASVKIFSPTASTATLIINDNAGGSPQTVPLSLLVINPQATVSSTSLSFSTQKVGTTSAAKTVTVKNTGNTPLTFGTLSVSGNFAIASGTTCANGGSLAASASCVINVTFTPTAKGARTGTLTIPDNALISPQLVGLSGTGN